jgi:hypothetical protein
MRQPPGVNERLDFKAWFAGAIMPGGAAAPPCLPPAH